MTNQEAHAQAFENGRKVGNTEGYARGKAEAFAEAGDLISVEAARKTAQRIFSDPVLIHAVDTTLKNTPRVATEPVKHGKMVKRIVDHECPWHTVWDCSLCGCNGASWYNYCPNCGARMDGGE